MIRYIKILNIFLNSAIHSEQSQTNKGVAIHSLISLALGCDTEFHDRGFNFNFGITSENIMI
jgi:hypothetical protein